MLSSLVSFSVEFMVTAIYSIFISLVLYSISQIVARYHSVINYWRDYWLVLIVLSLLAMMCCFVSFYSPELSLLDLSQLQYYGDSNNQIDTIANIGLVESQAGISSIEAISMTLFCVYILGVFYCLRHLLAQIIRIKSIIGSSITLNNAIESLRDCDYKILKRLSIEGQVNICISEELISPFVFQLKNKYMVLPITLFDKYSQDQIKLILEHEVTHIKRHDSVTILLTQAIKTLLWFNPFIRVFQRKMNWALEAYCDNQVLLRKPHLRKIYAQTMLKILRESATKTSNHMVAAFSIKTHRSITMRINNIMKSSAVNVNMKHEKIKLWSSVAVLAGLIFAVQPRINAATQDSMKTMLNPVLAAKVSSLYGSKNRFHEFHKGIDLATTINTHVVATTNGVVRVSTDELKGRKNYGTIIIIDHADGLHSVYAHLNGREVLAGQHVKAGQLIGYVGETGKASGPHLHLEILKDNKNVNPADYIKF